MGDNEDITDKKRIVRLELENEKLKVDYYKLNKESDKAQRALKSRVWVSAIAIAAAIAAFSFVASDMQQECFQHFGDKYKSYENVITKMTQVK